MQKGLLFVGLFIVFCAQGQGCSDAGICQMGKEGAGTKTVHELSYAPGLAKGEAGVEYFTQQIGYRFQSKYGFGLNTQIGYSQAHGAFGTRGQFSDALLLGHYKTSQWTWQGGVKIPFSNGNLKINGYDLPMAYQPSLGTFDGLASVQFQWHQWSFQTAAQIPLQATNKNAYFADGSGTTDFPTTNLFHRNPDGLFRLQYDVKWGKHTEWQPALLSIYHFGNDSFQDRYGQRQLIVGSEGFTINAVLGGAYSLSHHQLRWVMATPLVVRDIRPDGLTRSWVVSLTYAYQIH